MTREGEISVFRAERYYSLTVEDHEAFSVNGSKPGQKKENPLHLPRMKQKTKTWRSREVNERYSSSTLICNEYFSDKKSPLFHKKGEKTGLDGKEFRYDTFHDVLDGRTMIQPRNLADSVKEDHFAFPILKSLIGNLGEKELNEVRQFSELKWDAIPKAQNFLEDMESDTSSDLFEIDTLSVSGQTLTSMQESDGGSSSITAKTGYEPSEATTNSAVLDFSAEKTATNVAKNAAQSKSMAEKDLRRSISSKLLGCKSQKAVTVVETAHRTTTKKKTKLTLRSKNLSVLKS